MNEQKIKKSHRSEIKIITREVIILRQMRIFRKIKPEEAAKSISISKITLLRFENGRTTFSKDRIKALIKRYRYSIQEFNKYISGELHLPDLHPKYVYKRPWKPEQEKRKYKKIITKEVKIIRCMREMRGYSKPMAGKICGLHPSVIDHLESGRTNLSMERIKMIINCYGYTIHEFNYMCEQKILRPEVIKECSLIIKKLNDEKLIAVQALLKNFL